MSECLHPGRNHGPTDEDTKLLNVLTSVKHDRSQQMRAVSLVIATLEV
jgi:hypothetical protein